MSLKNNFVNKITKKLIQKASDEKMIEIFATARETVEYDKNNHRISNCKIPKKYSYSQYFCNNIRLEEMKVKNYSYENSEAKVVLFFHGGGYIGKMNSIYTKFMCRFCKYVPDYKIIAIEYRTLKEYKFPCAYDDALEVWDYLMEEGYNPENIIIMGDSAGGGLGLALTMCLRDSDIKIKAYMGLSPWVNLDDSSDCFTNPEKKSTDPLFGTNNVISILGKMYSEGYNIKDWRISPLFGNFKKLPPMFITYGTLEILRDDIIELVRKASFETDVVLRTYRNCQHDVITSDTKEAKIAWKDIKKYINSLG